MEDREKILKAIGECSEMKESALSFVRTYTRDSYLRAASTRNKKEQDRIFESLNATIAAIGKFYTFSVYERTDAPQGDEAFAELVAEMVTHPTMDEFASTSRQTIEETYNEVMGKVGKA